MTNAPQASDVAVDYDEELQPIHWAILTLFLLSAAVTGLLQLIF